MDKLKRSNSLYSKRTKKDNSNKRPRPRASLFGCKEAQKTQFETEENEINDLIQQRSTLSHIFSKSLINPSYTPLTIEDKEKVLADLNETSTNRFKEYNDIFDQIKQQISDINYSLYESGNESFYKKPHKDTVDTINKHPKSIKEKEGEEEHFVSPNYICKTAQKIFNYDSYIDEEAFDENVNVMTIKNNFIQDNAKLLLSCRCDSKTNLDGSTHDSPNIVNHMLFIEARAEYTKRRKMTKKKRLNQNSSNGKCTNKKTFNSKEFYNEPSITSESNIDKKEIPVKYCNCLIY